MESEEKGNAGTLRQAVEGFERRLIIAELINARGRMNVAARALGITTRVMGLRVRKYAIDVRAYRRITARVDADQEP